MAEKNNKVTERKALSKKDLIKSYLLWVSMNQAMYSYERMQANGFLSAMAPAIERFYPDNKEERIAAAKRHMEFFNTEPYLTGPGIIGLTLSLEEERANGLPLTDEDINGVKTSLMGPCAGIGDTLRQATLIPIIGSIAISIGLEGSFFGPILYMLATLLINYGLSYTLFNFSYQKGKEGIQKLFSSGQLEKIMTMATTTGAIALGGLAATTVKMSSSLVLTLGENQLAVQDILDKIILNLMPLGIIFLTYWLIQKKKISVIKILVLLATIATIGVLIGFL
jgi:mannose/fructose/N-acetylgalactosamine-specific phosphotransferase system component IID